MAGKGSRSFETKIRDVRPDDAEAVVRVTSAIEVHSFSTVPAFRRLVERGAPATTERLVAEVDGVVRAWAPSGLHGDGSGWFWIGVSEPWRSAGIGSELYNRIETRLRGLGAQTVRSLVNDEQGRRFVTNRRFQLSNSMRSQALDLTTAELPLPERECLPLSLLGVEAIGPLYLEARSDIISRSPRAEFSLEDFRRAVVESEIVDPEISTVIVEQGRPVALALVVTNKEQRIAGADLTAVSRSHRRQGLGHTVKLAALHRAKDAGFRLMVAENDDENAPMLAINRRLGFEPSIVIEQYAKTL
jgi:GNAT superfamily N-acetyltransferase